MADLRSLKVQGDTGSEELKRLRKSYNALLDALGTYMDTVEAAAGGSAAAATTFLAAVEVNTTGVLKITTDPDIGNNPARSVTS